MASFSITPAATAVLGIDLQNCFVEQSPIAAPTGLDVVQKMNRLAAEFRAAGSTVIWTRHVVRPDHSNVGVLGLTVPPVLHGVIDDNAPSAALHSKVDVQPGDIVLAKPHFGAFQGTDLETILRSRSIDTVVVGGIATNFCCETTAREAHAREFKVLFLSDGTGTFGLTDNLGRAIQYEEVQRITLATLAFGFAEVLTVADACSKISSRSIAA
jgi:ureidoacrylate peracid hydrolase